MDPDTNVTNEQEVEGKTPVAPAEESTPAEAPVETSAENVTDEEAEEGLAV